MTTIVANKLFNAEKVLKHIYKVPAPVLKVLSSRKNPYGSDLIPKREWNRMKPYLINIESLTVEFFNNFLFRDSVEMAIKLDKRINCSWSLNRLKTEHDVWAKEIRKIALEFEPMIELNPYKIYEDFEKFTGYRLLRTNHDLIEEGHKQDHCVAGYSNSVINGNCGIFQVSGYTLEVNYRIDYSIGPNTRKKILHYGQLRGFRNCSAPRELDDTVQNYIKAFNNKYDFDEYENYLKQNKVGMKSVLEEIEREELPF